MKLVGLTFGIIGIVAMFCMCVGTEFVFNAAFYRSEGEEKLLKTMQAEINSAYARHPVYGPLLRAAQKNAQALADNNESMQAQNESALKGVRRYEVRQYNTSINENVKTSGEVAALIERAKVEIEKPIRERYAAAIANARGENATGKLTGVILTIVMPVLVIVLAFFRDNIFVEKYFKVAAWVGAIACQAIVSWQSAKGSYKLFGDEVYTGLWFFGSLVVCPLIYDGGAKCFFKLLSWYYKVERKKPVAAEGNGFHTKPEVLVEQDDGPRTPISDNASDYVAWLYNRLGKPERYGRLYARVSGLPNTTFRRRVAKFGKKKVTEAEVKRGLSERTIQEINAKLKGVEA